MAYLYADIVGKNFMAMCVMYVAVKKVVLPSTKKLRDNTNIKMQLGKRRKRYPMVASYVDVIKASIDGIATSVYRHYLLVKCLMIIKSPTHPTQDGRRLIFFPTHT